MSMLLPQTREATVLSVRPVDIHGARFVDVTVAFGETEPPLTSRVAANECPADLTPGERVSVRIVLGLMTRVTRGS
jgi:hypothetical protein